MTPLRIVYGVEAVRASLLKRRPLDELVVAPAVAATIERVFGEPLTPDQVVERIIADVRRDGDAAVRHYSLALDGVAPPDFEVDSVKVAGALQTLSSDVAAALELAASRVRAFHERQLAAAVRSFQEDGLGQLVWPLARVGVYAPGGTAVYPSTVLMTAIPAKVAGVAEVVLATPPQRDGSVNPLLLAAAALSGVDRVFAVGGVQAIAALAFGTESLPKVDKICGPGNIFVVLAKRRLFGVVGIDGLPGPTETVVIADDGADPAVCAADLLAQAEHDSLATAILITTSAEMASHVVAAVAAQLDRLPRADLVRAALEGQGGIAVVDDLDTAVALANEFAPEHLCLLVRDAERLLSRVRHAGGVFVGEAAAEAIGDYLAGPSHVMPTGGTARFGSPLGVDDFLKRVNLVGIDAAAARRLAAATAVLARAEGLDAHARAAELRAGVPVERSATTQ